MPKKKRAKTHRRRVSRINRDTRGSFSPIIGVVIVVVILLGVGGYFFLNKSGSLPGAASRLAVPAACKNADADMCRFMTNFSAKTSYSGTTIATDASGKKSESTWKIDGSNKFQMTSSENGKENSNMISIGNTTYIKDYTDGKWWKQTVDTPKENLKDSLKFNFDNTNAKDTTPENKTTYKLIGKEVCGNLQCFKYQVIDPSADTTEYIWFDDNDYLLRKTETKDKSGMTSTTTFNYDTVSISEPTPVKTGTPGQMYGIPSSAMPSMQPYVPPAATSTPDQSSDNSGQ